MAESPKQPKPKPVKPKSGIQALEYEMDHLEEVAGQAAELLNAKSSKPPSGPSELPTRREQPRNSIGWLALTFALFERALDVIGFHNLVVGALLFTGAFICFAIWFVRLEIAQNWRFGKRAVIVGIIALLYFPLVGVQLVSQYYKDRASVLKAIPALTPTNVELRGEILAATYGTMTPDKNGVLFVLVIMNIVNSGDFPTTARQRGAWIEIQKGSVSAMLIDTPFKNGSIDPKGPGGRSFSFEDNMLGKSLKLIQPGETVPGFLLLRFADLRKSDVEPSMKVCVRFVDSRDHEYNPCYQSGKWDSNPSMIPPGFPGLKPSNH